MGAWAKNGAWLPEDPDDLLKEPKTKMAKLARRLSEAAMSLIHHDAPEREYNHEVAAMDRKFTAILKGKIR